MGFDRVELKTKAKSFLKDYFIYAFLICILPTLFNTDFFKINISTNNGINNPHLNGLFGFILSLYGLLAGIVVIIFTIFVVNPLIVSTKHYFLKGPYDSVSSLTYAFYNPNYLNIVKVMFIKNLIILILSFFLVIPGIIAHYRFCMVDYILAEHPEYDLHEVFDLSRDLTMGYKTSIFVLDLSFVGWQIVAGIFFGLGYFVLNPYIYATYAQLYYKLKFYLGIDSYDQTFEAFY